MANYVGCTRTNYFRVKDEDAFKSIIRRMVSEDEVVILHDDKGRFGFCSSCPIIGIAPEGNMDEDEDVEENRDNVAEALMELLPDGEAIIWSEIGHEKLRYLVGGAYVITNQTYEYVNMFHAAVQTAQQIMHDPDWETDNSF